MIKNLVFLALMAGALLYSVDAKAINALPLLTQTYCVNNDDGYIQGCNAYWKSRITNEENKAKALESCTNACQMANFIASACYLKCTKVREFDK